MNGPSRAVALHGTDEAVDPPRILRAGRLSAELEAGNLRYLRWGGEEVLRAVSFVVRDRDWGTYAPEIEALDVREEADAFHVALRAVAGDAAGRIRYDARIEGRADGTLRFEASGGTETGFETNRTGFVILHPIAGVAGTPVTVRHIDGRIVEGRFPETIDPVQPMMDLRALTHATPGGLTVETVMEGDTFEMEDQRNWTDASYKTYVRPLALPWPYRIEPGEAIAQAVTVTITGGAGARAEPGAVALAPGASLGPVPPVGLGLTPEDIAATRSALDALADLGPAHLVLHHDPRAGHDRGTLAAMLDVARAVGAEPWLEAVVAATDDAGAAEEVSALGRVAAALGHPFATVLVSPAPDLKCTLPGTPWPDAPDAARLYDATRRAFLDARIGGGMFSYFTELNRKRPPTDRLDLVSFTTSPLVHAGDDRSVMETREAQPAVAASVARIAGATPWAVGPSAIGMRDNPYGAASKENPENRRGAMNRNDPRQRGLLGAAWTLGYVADFAAGGASAVAIGGATGAFGVVAAPTDDPQPWFDAHGGVYPAFHVLRGLSRLRGAAMRALGLPAAGPVCGMATEREIWIANAGPDEVEVMAPEGASVAVLDAGAFAEAAGARDFMDALRPLSGPLRLDAYAVARIALAAG